MSPALPHPGQPVARSAATTSAPYPPVGADHLAMFVDRLLDTRGAGRGPGAIPTGIDLLDELLAGGLRPGELTLVAAPTGVGASTLALGFARHAALRHGLRAAVLAPGSPRAEVLTRIVAAEARVPVFEIRSGTMAEDALSRVRRARHALASARLWVNAAYGVELTPDLVVDTVDYMSESMGGGLIVVDDLAELGDSISETVSGLRRLAHARDLAIVLVGSAAMRPDPLRGTPSIADLADWLPLEHVDVVLALDRPDAYEAESDRAGEADITVVKNRFGPTRTLTVSFLGHYATFASMAPGYD